MIEVPAAPGAVETVLRLLIANVSMHAPRSHAFVSARMCQGEQRPRPDALKSIAWQDFVLLTVADDGPGIPEQSRLDLFQAYRGLWICRQIVRAHGGDLWLDSTPQGASLSSAWPFVQPPIAPKR